MGNVIVLCTLVFNDVETTGKIRGILLAEGLTDLFLLCYLLFNRCVFPGNDDELESKKLK